MSAATILIIIGVILAVLIIIAIVVTSILKKKKIAKLDESIKRLQQENTTKSQIDSKVSLAPYVENYVDVQEEEKSETSSEEETGPKTTPIIEDLSDIDIFNFNDDDDDFDINEFTNNNKKDDEDFEDFLDAHSYTRKIVNKDLIRRFNKLSPEMKNILLGNLFNKYED